MSNYDRKLNKKMLFNPDAIEDQKVFGGETCNILDLSDIPKDCEIFHKLVDTAYNNNWLPHKVPMASDIYDYKNKMTPDEIEAYDNILSFLAFLDSIQTNNLPNIAAYCTNPHIVYALARQTWDEALHSKSYGWIFSSLMSKEKSKQLYFKWKHHPLMLERNKFIAGIYQDFVDNPSAWNFIRAVIANYMLEGIYFYNGFQFFHNLANRGLISGTDTQISYIQRDEIVHCTIFENIIKKCKKEYPEIFIEHKEDIKQMFKTATEWEINFSSDIIGDKILGMNVRSIIQHSHYLCDYRLKNIDEDPIYGVDVNPYKHLEKQAGVSDETSNRSNNFEVTSITYKSPEILNGWEEL